MTWLPRPSENPAAALHIGLTHEDMGTAPEFAQAIMEPNEFVAGLLPLPPVETCYGYREDDTDAVSNVKKHARLEFDRAARRLRIASDEQIKASRNASLSDQGRVEAMSTTFDTWAVRNGSFVENINGQYAILNRELRAIVQPAPIADIAGAVLDSEYRGIIRAMPDEAQRIIRVHTLAVEEPDNPILVAVLRADPAASGIQSGLHDALLMRYGLAKKAQGIISVWGAGCMLDAACYLVLHGTQRLAKAAGKEWQESHKIIDEAIENSPERRAFATALDAMIEKATSVDVERKVEE